MNNGKTFIEKEISKVITEDGVEVIRKIRCEYLGNSKDNPELKKMIEKQTKSFK